MWPSQLEGLSRVLRSDMAILIIISQGKRDLVYGQATEKSFVLSLGRSLGEEDTMLRGDNFDKSSAKRE